MRTERIIVLLSAALLALIGCTDITGKWVLDSVRREDARGHYAFTSITLNEDGTYTSTSELGGEVDTATGSYTYADGKLTFTMTAGKTRVHAAEMRAFGTRLKVGSELEGRELEAIMRRE